MSKNQHQNVETHEELSEVLKVRREKLQNLTLKLKKAKLLK